MELDFIEIIGKIINMLENNEYESFTYQNGKFHFVDKAKKIDIDAKLSNNNFYFKDNINKLNYIFAKRYLDDYTTLQNILVEKNDEKFYYSYIEKYSYIRLARLIRKNQNNEYLYTENQDIVNKSDEELLKFANENFDSVGVEEKTLQDGTTTIDIHGFNAFDEDNELGEKIDHKDKLENKDEHKDEHEDTFDNKHNGYYVEEFEDEFEDEDKYEDEDELSDDYEEADLDEMIDEIESELEDEDEDEYVNEDVYDDDSTTMAAEFEERAIDQYIDFVFDEADNYNEMEYPHKEEDLKTLSNYYKNIKCIVNGNKLENLEKIVMAQENESVVESKFYASVTMNEMATNLKLVLDAVTKRLENSEKNER